MVAYALRRLVAAILSLIAATAFTFVLVDASSDPLADLRLRQPPVPERTMEEVRERLYLDRSPPERYWLWLTGIGSTHGDIGLLRGRWGPSVRDLDVGTEVRDRAFVSLRLVGGAVVLMVGLGVVTGVVSAVRRYSRLDQGLTVMGFVGLAMPAFWLAALVKEAGVWANQRLGYRLFFTVGASAPDHAALGTWDRLLDTLGHLALPTLALTLTGYAIVSRYQRAAMLEVLDSDYVRLARAKGLAGAAVIGRHALRPSLNPVVTKAALIVSSALTGAVVVEVVFRWRGLGTFLVGSVQAADTYAVMAVVVLSGACIIVANLGADLLYGVLDPRVRDG